MEVSGLSACRSRLPFYLPFSTCHVISFDFVIGAIFGSNAELLDCAKGFAVAVEVMCWGIVYGIMYCTIFASLSLGK